MPHFKKLLHLGAIIAIVWASLLTAGAALAQEPEESHLEEDLITEPADPSPYEPSLEALEGVEGLVNQPTQHLPYQGYLTDASGIPLTGVYNLTFALYVDPVIPDPVWGPETHTAVEVNQGVFSVALGSISQGTRVQPINIVSDLTDTAPVLYLGITVDGVALTERLPIRPATFAYSLVPGARLVGNPDGTPIALRIRNTGGGATDDGMWVEGVRYALFANELGGGDVAIYSLDYVLAQGYRSIEPSYWAVSAMSGVAADPAALDVTHSITQTTLSLGGNGTANFYLPLDMPSDLYGQAVGIDEILVNYATSDDGQISSMSLVETSFTSGTVVIDSITNLAQGTTLMTETLSFSPTHVLTSTTTSILLDFALDFADANSEVHINGVRLTLNHGEALPIN